MIALIMAWYTVAVLGIFAVSVWADPQFLEEELLCELPLQLQSGWVCGVRRVADNRVAFASFLGVPYAAQPVGERRFSELEPVAPWDYLYDATTEGPVCPQHDIVYGKLLDKSYMSEACIFANIHVPIDALPDYKVQEPGRALQPRYAPAFSDEPAREGRGLPILLFVHGGGFAYGSGSAGVYGPEYMIKRNVIVITFNYRINVFGFLSLNSSSIPGNNGLRDIVTMLRWVRANARFFGGDPDNITLGGQSAGACLAHLITMSPAAKGLFRRAILMSGTAITGFYSPSPLYARFVAKLFLSNLGLNATDPEYIHQQLVKTPLQDIMQANKKVLNTMGFTNFHPVIESSFPGFTTILDTDPDVLLSKGLGNDIPLMVGFTSNEAETFRLRFRELDLLNRIKKNPTTILSPKLVVNLPEEITLELANKTLERYFDGAPTLDKCIRTFSDTFFVYPAIKLAEKRSLQSGAPVYLYRFSYAADFNVVRESKGLKPFKGAAHIEDMTFVFKPNSMEGAKGFTPLSRSDRGMADWMTKFVKNFMYCDDPVCNYNPVSKWPAASTATRPIRYQDIEKPRVFRYTSISEDEQEMMEHFDALRSWLGDGN